ncbi:MAG: Na(+)/H(+) antiporter subunit D [Planctomycetes bacterium]|nr:Na(+)/H(+) antiporter subunit D [Planctomycetota bacterium]
MLLNEIPPAVVMFIGAIMLVLARGRVRWLVGLAVPLLALAQSWVVITQGVNSSLMFMGMELSPVHVHPASPAFATIFCLMAGIGTLFALNQQRKAELPAAFVYAGGALGVTFAGDLLSMLVFWEVMLVSSAVIVWCGGTRASYGAGVRYFGLHALAGVAMLTGVVMIAAARTSTGAADPLAFVPFADMASGWSEASFANAGRWLILLSLLVCAAAPPFSAWVSDAYPEASVWGSVFLSAFTTKAAVFALIVAFAGFELLIWLGLFMAFYGIVYAMLENDIRRVLAYSIVNQVGFMLVGIGIGTELAIDGATAHAFAHIIYKAALMMAAGSVIYVTSRHKLSELGGLYRSMPVTLVCCVIAALAISAFPLTSGFTTKTMVDDAVAHQAHALALSGKPQSTLILVWLGLEIASAGVFLHAGIKFPWFVFFAKDSGLRPKDPPWNMQVGMVVLAALCILLGVFPGVLYGILPYEAAALEYAPIVFDYSHVMKMLGLLLFSGLAFFMLLPMLERKRTITLDIDWTWRRFLPRFWREIATPLGESALRVRDAAVTLLLKPLGESRSHSPVLRYVAGWSISAPVLLVGLMLLGYLGWMLLRGFGALPITE